MKNRAQGFATCRSSHIVHQTDVLPVKSDSSARHVAGDAVDLLTVQVAAQRLALSRSMLYNLMERGDLAYVKIGRARRIPLAEIDRLVHESLVSR